MPELRRDPTTGNWVIVAAERASRPGSEPRRTDTPPGGQHDPSCPFCAGNEALTPPEIARRPETGAWVARVVPNKYPALVPEPTAIDRPTDDLHIHAAAMGHYEVIVEGPTHHPERHDPATLLEVFLAAQDRCKAFAEDVRLESFALFKNYGVSAGASLIHPHWQLAAMPLVPHALQRILEVSRVYRESHGRSLYHDLVRSEVEDGSRVVGMNAGFVAAAPYAPQWSGEVWMLPRAGAQHFSDVDLPNLHEFAELLAETLDRVTRAFGDPDYNVVVLTAPLRRPADASFSWHARIQPRITVQGGFESYSGMAITVLAPERTAELLREVD
ncbi:MAG: hypothetical protein ACE5PT_04975 [Gemmatimonadales bacterium]